MPVLLETIADRTALHAMDLASVVQEDIRSLKNSTNESRLRHEVSAALFLNRQIGMLADLVMESKGEVEGFLRKGVSGHDFRILARQGERLVRLVLSGLESAGQLWDQIEGLGAPADTVRDARDVLAKTAERIIPIRTWADHLVKLAGKTPPEIDPALIELGAECIRQGRFRTTAQILQSLRNPAS